MKALQIETGDARSRCASCQRAAGRSRGRSARRACCRCWRSGFASRRTSRRSRTRIVVLPFANLAQRRRRARASTGSCALADAIAARLARMPSLVVRPSSALMQIPLSVQQMDPLAVGQRLLVRYVLAGNFLRSEDGFDLNWQLLDVPRQSVRTGGAIRVASLRSDRGADGDLERGLCGTAGHGAEVERRRRASARCERSLAGRAGFRGVSAGARAAVVVHGAHGVAQ